MVDSSKGRIPETTLRCIRHIRQAMPGSTISVEVEKPNREGLAELAAEADVVFYSRTWAEVSWYSLRNADAHDFHGPVESPAAEPLTRAKGTLARRLV